MQRWTSKTALAFVHDPKAPFKRADLELIGVDQRVASFSAHVYLNNPRVSEDAGIEGRGYAGSFAFFGHGEDCWGDAGHCDIPAPVSAFDKRAESTSQPANVTVDVTEALRELGDKEETKVTILAWPATTGREASGEDPLHFDQLMLVTYT
jgi:hypothetical protein